MWCRAPASGHWHDVTTCPPDSCLLSSWLLSSWLLSSWLLSSWLLSSPSCSLIVSTRHGLAPQQRCKDNHHCSVNASDVALMSSILPRRISVLHLAVARPHYCTLSPISCTRYSHLLLQPPAPAPAHLNPPPGMAQRRHVRVCLSLVDTRYNAEMQRMPEMLQNRCTECWLQPNYLHNQSGKLLKVINAHYPELANFRFKWVEVIRYSIHHT